MSSIGTKVTAPVWRKAFRNFPWHVQARRRGDAILYHTPDGLYIGRQVDGKQWPLKYLAPWVLEDGR